MEEVKKYGQLFLMLIALAGVFIQQGATSAEMKLEIAMMKSQIEHLQNGNTAENAKTQKDIEKLIEGIENLDEVKETVQVVKEIKEDVEELKGWRDEWQVRVLPLDTEQDGRIKANALEIERILQMIRQ